MDQLTSKPERELNMKTRKTTFLLNKNRNYICSQNDKLRLNPLKPKHGKF